MLLANMGGSGREKLLLTGKSKQTHCFQNFKWFPFDYKANAKVWTTGTIFEECVLKLDKQFTNQGRKIIFFLTTVQLILKTSRKIKIY